MKCTQSRLYGQVAFKNAKVGPGSGDPSSGFFGVAPARRPDECNARQVYLESPKHWDLDWLCPKISQNTRLETMIEENRQLVIDEPVEFEK